jgi:hypothetical protein
VGMEGRDPAGPRASEVGDSAGSWREDLGGELAESPTQFFIWTPQIGSGARMGLGRCT